MDNNSPPPQTDQVLKAKSGFIIPRFNRRVIRRWCLKKKTTADSINLNLKDVLETVDKYKTLFTMATMVYGYIYLYCKANGIPFPIDSPIISMLFLSIATNVFFIFLLLICSFFLIRLITGDEFGPIYGKIDKRPKMFWIYFKLLGWTVISAFTIPLLNDPLESYFSRPILPWLLFAQLLLCIAISLLNKQNLPQKDLGVSIFFLIITQLISILFTWVIMAVSLLLVSRSLSNLNNLEFLYIYISSMIVLLFYFFVASLPYKTLLESVNIELIIISSLLIAFFIPLNLNLFFFESRLERFSVGGGYEAIYYLDDSQKKSLPREILDTIDVKKTKPLIVLMSVGEKKYVKLKDAEEDSPVYGLNLGKANEVVIKKTDSHSQSKTGGVLKTTMAF